MDMPALTTARIVWTANAPPMLMPMTKVGLPQNPSIWSVSKLLRAFHCHISLNACAGTHEYTKGTQAGRQADRPRFCDRTHLRN